MLLNHQSEPAHYNAHFSGGNTVKGNTRSHTEHDGQALAGRKYFVGDDTGG